MKNIYDVTVIGGGPAGLSAAVSAKKEGASVLLIERENRLGGILKQCIHDGFGLVRFNKKLTGPEYAESFIDEFKKENIDYLLLSFVTDIKKENDLFLITIVNKEGLTKYLSKTIVLATGCRERTAKQVSIHGDRPAGIFTAGLAQRYINIDGMMPSRNAVILGSGDIGLIMARRLTLEGSHVIGVYEAKGEPSGLTRNIHQCLIDYDIPLHLSHTVTKTFGKERLEAVEICQVDENMNPKRETAEIIKCDTLILSVGLIPENELAEKIGVSIDPRTKGAYSDQFLQTDVKGVFACGNALHVNDLVDYVSESGETAGKNAAKYKDNDSSRLLIETEGLIQYIVPQNITVNKKNDKVIFYFRSNKTLKASIVSIFIDGKEVFTKKYPFMRPPEMERLELDLSSFSINEKSKIKVGIFEV